MEESVWLVVQYPLKSLKGSKRDHWLKDKVTQYLDGFLSESGLGHVDGFDIGRSVSPTYMSQYVLNIFCVVADEQKGISLVKRVLREYRLDYTRIKIATMPVQNGTEYCLKYAYKKGDTEFSL